MSLQKLFFLFILFFIIEKNKASSSPILDESITTIELKELENKVIKDESKIFTNEKFSTFKFYKIDLSSLTDVSEENYFSFIKISIQLKKENSYKSFLLYVNKTLNDFIKINQSPTDYSIHDKNPTVYLPQKYFSGQKFFYFFIQGDKNTEFIYSIETIINDIILKEKENKFNILAKPGKIEFFYKLQQGIPKGYFLISLLTSGVIEDGKEIYLNAICPSKNDVSMGKYYPYFINGVGLLIEDKEMIDCKDDDYFFFKIILYNNLKNQISLEFNSQYLSSGSQREFLQKEIYENSIYTSILLGQGDINRQCFKFQQDLEDRDIFYSYSFNIRSTSSDLILSYQYQGDFYYIKNKNISFTGMIDINTQGVETPTIICIHNNKKYNSGIQFQLTPKFETEIYNLAKLPLMPLINGFPTYFLIEKVKSMIYKIDISQLLYGNDKSNKKIIKYHLIKLNQVDIELGHIRCQKFALSCQQIYNTIFTMNMDLYLNYEYEISNSLYYNEYVFVSCNDENKDCQFLLDINLSDNTDSYPIQLIQSENFSQDYYYKPISRSYIDKYKISLSNKLPENSKLVIILYMFSGDTDLSIYDYNDGDSNIDLQRVIQDTEYYSIGKKKYLIYNIKSFNNNLNYNMREIILKIIGISSGYYSLKYYTINNNEQNNNLYFTLPVGEINFDKITFNDGTKTYLLSSLLSMSKVSYYHTESNNEYYIAINSVNCILEIEFAEKNYIGKETQLFFYQKDISKSQLKIRLKELDSHSKNENEFCIYYIFSNSVEFHQNSIVINEGVLHSMILNNKIESITYKYPYPYDDEIVSISLYKYYKGDLSVRVDINNLYTTHSLTMKNIYYKKLVIYVNVLKKYCSKSEQRIENYKDIINLCPINIYINLPVNKAKDEIRENKIQIEVLSGGKTPTYIQSGEMRFESVRAGQYTIGAKQKNKYVYFYSDIGMNEYPSEIILNNKFGICEAVAKIVSKNKVDMFPNWDRRVRLPSIEENDNTNYLKYDYDLNKITITKKDLEECKEGCEIYIGVFTRETSLYFQINDFFVMFNKNFKNQPINLLFNQNIDDSITKHMKTKYYISHLENENINNLVFTFNSDFCSLCIIMVDENKEDFDLQNINKCDWKLDNIINGYKNYMLSIKSNDNKLKGKDLTSVKFISKISSPLIDNKDNLFYSLKINKQISSLPMIINVDSINNEIAQLDSQTGLAYYSIRVHEYQIINEINLCVISDEQIINDNLILYAKIIRQEDYNKEGFNEKLFKEDYTNYTIISNANSNPNNCLSIQIPNIMKDEDKIIFLVVKCNSIHKVDLLMNHYVKIMVAFYKSNINTSLKNNNFKLYNISLETPQFFVPLSKNKYSVVEVNCLRGKGGIIVSDQDNNNKNEIMIDNTSNKRYKILLDLNNQNSFDIYGKFASLKIKNKDENVNNNFLMFYISYYNKNINYNLEFIDINKNNIIYYPIINNLKNHKSLSYYFNINDSINDYLLVKISLNKEYIKKNENLNVVGGLINDEFIYENVISEKQIIFSPLYGKPYFNHEEKIIYILFDNNEINKYKNNFGYGLISIGNNYFDYDDFNEKNSNFFIEIGIISYNENILNDCSEIINKFSNVNHNKDEEDINYEDVNKGKSSTSNKTMIILIIFFIIIIAYLFIRWKRKRNVAQMSEFFNKYNNPIIN